MEKLIEIRTYTLKSGTTSEFNRIMNEKSLPLHTQAGIDVVAHGPCLHDPQGYFLIRAFDNLENCKELQAAFYASDAWRMGPRNAIVERIEIDANATFWLEEEALDVLRNAYRGNQKLG